MIIRLDLLVVMVLGCLCFSCLDKHNSSEDKIDENQVSLSVERMYEVLVDAECWGFLPLDVTPKIIWKPVFKCGVDREVWCCIDKYGTSGRRVSFGIYELPTDCFEDIDGISVSSPDALGHEYGHDLLYQWLGTLDRDHDLKWFWYEQDEESKWICQFEGWRRLNALNE